MNDMYKYEEFWSVHSPIEDFESGERCDNLEAALECAQDTALQEAHDMEITHVYARLVNRVKIHVEIEDV